MSADKIEQAQKALMEQYNKSTSLPSDAQKIVDVLAQKIADEGLLKDWLARARVHGLEPGLGIEYGQKYFANIYLKGVDADAWAEAGGDATRLPSEVRSWAIQRLTELGARSDPEANAEREALMRMLGWNREQDVPASGNVPPDALRN